MQHILQELKMECWIYDNRVALSLIYFSNEKMKHESDCHFVQGKNPLMILQHLLCKLNNLFATSYYYYYYHSIIYVCMCVLLVQSCPKW